MANRYTSVIDTVRESVPGDDMSRDERMRVVVDALWAAFGGPRGDVSWVGFYLASPAEPPIRELVLGPCRDRPACSPIGMHGVCGRAVREGPLVVDDVRTLGLGYIACDPRDRSEAVYPLRDAQGRTWAVLDLDSRRVGAFDAEDLVGLGEVLRAAGMESI